MTNRAYLFSSLLNSLLMSLLISPLISLLSGPTALSLCSAQEVFEFTPTAHRDATAQQRVATSFPTLPLLSEYRGEEARGVRYLSSEERSQARLVIKDGRLLNSESQPLNPTVAPKGFSVRVFPEQPPVSEALARGFAIYVMSASGEFTVSFQAEPHRLHHSSLVAGGRVSAAGEMIIFQGRLYAINNRSGHYRPPPVALERVIKVLKQRGVSFEGVFIKKYGSNF